MKIPQAIANLLLVLLTVIPGAAQDTNQVQELRYEPVDKNRDRMVPLKVYTKQANKPSPVILYSHGLGSSREAKAYLGKTWASHGYVAVFMQHAGSDIEALKAARGGGPGALKGGISRKTGTDRYGDVAFVIDQLERWNASTDHPLAGKLDLEKMGMSGHSFGAMTTQGLMGQKFILPRSYGDPRLDAFFGMSPSPGLRLSPKQAFGHIKSPVLMMTGSEDVIKLTPRTTPEKRRQVYEGLPDGDKYQLFLEGADHFAFSEDKKPKVPHHHAAIQQISTRFWDAYLKGDPAAKKWLQSKQVRESAKLVPKDQWEWK